MQIDLVNLKPQRQVKPPRILIYGEPKVGKSTFATRAPNALILDLEDGLDGKTSANIRIKTVVDFEAALDALENQAHGFRTVVIDTIDWLEKLVHEDICARAKASSISDKNNATTAYGNGYIVAKNQLAKYITRLDALRENKGMAIILLAHSLVKRIDLPDTESHDSYIIKMHEKATALFVEWVDVLGFAKLETMIDKDKKATTGERKLILADTKYATVGNRYGLPPSIALEWQAFSQAFSQANNVTKGE